MYLKDLRTGVSRTTARPGHVDRANNAYSRELNFDLDAARLPAGSASAGATRLGTYGKVRPLR
jgi:hypothetical protein